MFMKKDDLKNSCDKVENFTYMKSFTSEEIQEFKNNLSIEMIEVDSLETKLKEIKDEYKEKLKPHKLVVKECLTYIRDKARLINEECYINFEGEYAIYYNSDGEEIYKRPLDISEKQKTIFMETRKAQ